MTHPFTPDHVQRILDGFGLGLRVDHYDDTTFTSADAARAIGCELGQIAKSVCLMVGERPVLVVASGDVRISDAKIAKRFGIGRKKVKIATPEQCVALFGYPPGGVAPVGHRSDDVTVIVDASLGRWDTVHAAAGTSHDNFTLTFEQLCRITGGEVCDCAKDG
ncbi:MAG: YbaK/EbsC family protein [Spirochaetota bacterium]